MRKEKEWWCKDVSGPVAEKRCVYEVCLQWKDKPYPHSLTDLKKKTGWVSATWS